MTESETPLRRASAALAEWGIEPDNLRRTDSGLNNVSYAVRAGDAGYVLRHHRDTTGFGRPAYEHALLQSVGKLDLPFAVPVPLEGRCGGTHVFVEGERYSLYPQIPGAPPERGSLRDAGIGGSALGALDVALAGVELPGNFEPRPVFGKLDDLCGTSGSAEAMLSGLPVPDQNKRELPSIFAEVRELSDGLHSRLPRQVVHSDASPGNVLITGGRVSGIIDFEFAAPDLRVLDLAAALDTFCLFARDDEMVWPLVRALAGGYAGRVNLTRPELDALPGVLMVRQATLLLHWVSRNANDIEGSISETTRRCENALRLRHWLRENGKRLTDEVSQAACV